MLNIITDNVYYDTGELVIKNGISIGYLKQSNLLDNNNTLNQELRKVFTQIYELKDRLNNLQKQMNESLNDSEKLEKIIKKYDSTNNLFEAKDGYNIDIKINNVLNGLGFKDYDLDMKVSNLSGGEKVRFSMVKILLQEPELLVLDEPTNHLDFEMLNWLEKYIESYKGAIIVVSHDRYFLDKVANIILEIENCKLYKYKGNYSKFLTQKEEKVKKKN